MPNWATDRLDALVRGDAVLPPVTTVATDNMTFRTLNLSVAFHRVGKAESLTHRRQRHGPDPPDHRRA
jgi:hypothetical protein